MKKIVVIALLLLPWGLHAAEVSFAQGLWVSDDSPSLGQELRVYAVVTNSSGSDISGDVIFYDGITQVAAVRVSVAKNGGYSVVQTSYVVPTGSHRIHAELRDGEDTVVAKTGELQISADQGVNTSEKGSFLDYASSTAADLVNKGEDYAQSYAPGVVAGASSTFAWIEDFRTSQADTLRKSADRVYGEAQAEGRGAHIGPTASSTKTTSYKTVGKQFEYLALAALAYLFSHRFWFYLLGIILLLWIIRKVVRICRRLISGRPDY